MEDHIVGGLSRAEALERTQQGGTIVCLSMPSNVDFGIDLRSYSVGPQFRGIKMIPCYHHSAGAMHFVTCGSELATCGSSLRYVPRMYAFSDGTQAMSCSNLLPMMMTRPHTHRCSPPYGA